MATGGKRPGSGRKPAALAAYRLRALDWDAYYAIKLLIAVMDDEQQPVELRARCAEAVVRCVWGGVSAREMARQDVAAETV